GSTKATISPRAALTPVFRAAPSPWFDCRITRNCGNCAATSETLSLLPPATMITSKLGYASRLKDRRHRAIVRCSLSAQTTTDPRGDFLGGGRPKAPHGAEGIGAPGPHHRIPHPPPRRRGGPGLPPAPSRSRPKRFCHGFVLSARRVGELDHHRTCAGLPVEA